MERRTTMRRIRGAQLTALVAMIGVFALGGCGGKYYWSKPGSTRDQFDADSRACAKEATVSPAAAPSIEQSAYRACLSARGYVREKLAIKSEGSHRGIEQFD
jgi:hypothetical protein